MRKLIILLIAALFALSDCDGRASPADESAIPSADVSNANDSAGKSAAANVKYDIMSTDWPVYESVEELNNASKYVVLGKVNDVSFEVLDVKTNNPPAPESDKSNCLLHTVYSIDVITSYKGDAPKTLKFCMVGGREGAYLDEQLAALRKADMVSENICLVEDMPVIDKDRTYLFAICQLGDAMPTLTNASQSAFAADSPLVKDEYSYLSLKDIVSSYGADKWQAFQSADYAVK